MAVFRAFFSPIFHFTFDDPRINAVTSWFDSLTADFSQQRFIPRLEGLRIAAVAFRQSAFEDLETSSEGKVIGIEARRTRGLKHKVADHKMRQRQSINFLKHALRRLAAEVGRFGCPLRILMRLLFVEDQFMLPAPM